MTQIDEVLKQEAYEQLIEQGIDVMSAEIIVADWEDDGVFNIPVQSFEIEVEHYVVDH